MPTNLETCMSGCPYRQRAVGGIGLCSANGKPYIENAETSVCPKGRFDPNSPPAPPYDPSMPREKWPLAARIIAKLATTEDRGVGDTIARVIDPLGGSVYRRWYRRITGSECSCTDRQGKLNAMYPYIPGNE